VSGEFSIDLLEGLLELTAKVVTANQEGVITYRVGTFVHCDDLAGGWVRRGGSARDVAPPPPGGPKRKAVPAVGDPPATNGAPTTDGALGVVTSGTRAQ
jgi:hypothetical protein